MGDSGDKESIFAESGVVPQGQVESKSDKCDLVKQSAGSIEELVEAYCAFGNVATTSEYLGMNSSTVQKRLQKEARRRGLSDIKMLQGGVGRSIETAKLTRTYLVKLIESQDYRCKYSGIELTPETASLDHTTPVSKGGQHVPENVAWVHNEINRMKGQLSVEEFVSLCQKVVQYTR